MTGGYGALPRCGCSRSEKGTQFHFLKFRLGSAGEPTICSHCCDILNEDTVITQQKDRPDLCRIILILAVDNSLKLHIFEFSQFLPDLIAPINFSSRRSRRTSPPSLQLSAALFTSSMNHGETEVAT